ncbi:MAG: 5-(carboxyamino)imidazole ribonucleotide mutase [Magnetococcales bacterium]|nr:5-(carboxyamino)imidazole ribonucleotide mutase [Magnetococcales bacterium]
MAKQPLVGVLMGSDSDWEVMRVAVETLQELDIPCEARVSSAHRTPARTHEYAASAEARGLRMLIVGAGAAAHLAGVVASQTVLPVIGVPLSATDLKGMDALLATVQMPGGIPVATMAIGTAGAKNAALLAAQILALGDPELSARLKAQRRDMAAAVERKDAELQQKMAG